MNARWWIRIIFVLAVAIAWTPIIAIVVWSASTIWADNFATKIIQKEKAIIGKPISDFVQIYGKPNRVEVVYPVITNAFTRDIVRRFKRYEVWYYCPWPDAVKTGPGLKVFVQEGRIKRLKNPLY